MELRKDPITRSWVITGDEPELTVDHDAFCPFCPESPRQAQLITTLAAVNAGPWSARAVVHPHPLYHVEGDPGRRGEGLYDAMGTVGAHEVLIENPRHDRHLWNADDGEIEQFLILCAQRVQDLKNDRRFKYISIFKNHGPGTGQEFDHPTSQILATLFVPRRVLYELRAGREYYAAKERCDFCDILMQELHAAKRVIEVKGDYVAMCPYASRVAYETWVLPRTHEAFFERSILSHSARVRDLATVVRRTLSRMRSISDSFHLVVHSAPNTQHQSKTLGYWKTLDEDYHWHIEILPILPGKPQSYTFKEVYFSPMSPESAAARLRDIPVYP